MVSERFDILDCTGTRTGRTAARDEAHRSGLWHGSFHALITYVQGGRQQVLFQKRSSGKLVAPGRFDVSVGGHYAAGEGPGTAGPREIHEELGLDVAFRDLLPLGRRIFVHCFEPGIHEHEFQDIFLLPRPARPGPLVLQDGEVDAVLEIEIGQGIRLFSGAEQSVEGVLSRGAGSWEPVRVSAREFVPCIDNYYLRLLLAARRYLAGERDTLVI